MKTFLLKTKIFMERNAKFLAAIVSFIIILSYLPSIGPYIYNKIKEQDVVLYCIHGQDVDELLQVAKATWAKKILDDVSKNSKFEEFVKKYEKDSDKRIRPSLEIGLLTDLFNFYIPSYDSHSSLFKSIMVLEIRNNRKTEIRKIVVKVPDVFGVPKITVIAGKLHPSKIAELEKPPTLNKESRWLFLNEIEKLPPNSVIRIYIQGVLSPSPGSDPTVSFDGGAAKVIHLERFDPRLNDILSKLSKKLYPLWPSWEIFLLSTISIMLVYLVIKIRRKDKESKKD